MIGAENYLFDAAGRLVNIQDDNGNVLTITYQSGRIQQVADGAGRQFVFGYGVEGHLLSITAPDNTVVRYAYSGSRLSSISYPNNKMVAMAYNGLNLGQMTFYDGNIAVHKVEYAFDGNRLISVTEYGAENGSFVQGATTTYDYGIAAHRTVVTRTEAVDVDETEGEISKTVYTFNNDGDIVGEYIYTEEQGNVGTEGGDTIQPQPGQSGGNVIHNISNMLQDHNFETVQQWSAMPGNSSAFSFGKVTDEVIAKYGTCVGQINCTDATGENGIFQITDVLPAGPHTFSVYAQNTNFIFSNTNPGVFLRVTDTNGNVLAESERVADYDNEWVRLMASFELSVAQSVQVHIMLCGKGSAYVDAAQLEHNAYANPYNLLENGSFERYNGSMVPGQWEVSNGVCCTEEACFDMAGALQFPTSMEAHKQAKQVVRVMTARSTRETFTLSGWAKGYGVSDHERHYTSAPEFRLRAVIKYNDPVYNESSEETYTADFSAYTEGWQFVSVQFAKEKFRMIQDVTVYCDYGYNNGGACFDCIQLVRNSLETGLTAEDFPSDEGEDIEAQADTEPEFTEAVDAFGNVLTETIFGESDSTPTLYRSFGYSSNGNHLIRETDTRGNNTTYTVDAATSRNSEVTDRCGNKTAYEYDASGHVTKVTSKNANGVALANVEYEYGDFDQMTEIARGDGLKYALQYNAFHNLEAIGVDGKAENLVSYTYKKGNGRLKQITYANGDTMYAAYNSVGQLVSEKWKNASNTVVAHYKYVYDNQGNIVRSIDISAAAEYNYVYEEGRIVLSSEYSLILNGEVITGKTLVHSIRYSYNSAGRMTQKCISFADGGKRYIQYPETEGSATEVQFDVNGLVTSKAATDELGRKVSDELSMENKTQKLSRQFTYHAGQVTPEHIAHDKVKTAATTQLVSQIRFEDGRTIDYTYDNEERITKVVDSLDGTTEYTYDALGQLLTEIRNGVVVNTMTYDNYGNILTKNGVSYQYGNGAWKDLLTGVGTRSISYDAQGNPTNYMGTSLDWEKGRQLKRHGSYTYTYNANGIRTSKTVDGVLHTYDLDGTKILRETWGSNKLIPLYDSEDMVCGIQYNGTPYFFLKNLQGDIIAITDSNANMVARYRYDAWGVCTIVSDTTSVGIATVNPFRYRGYYYDSESQLYYLQSRYYNPAFGRFINADDALVLTFGATVTAFALYTYCCNSPVNMVDFTGYLAFSMAVIVSAAVVGAMLSALAQIAANWMSGKKGASIFKGVLGSAVGGAINAALLLVLWYVPGSNVIAAFVAGFVQAVIDGLFDVLVYKTLTWNQFIRKCCINGLINSAANLAGNFLGGKLVFINKGWFKPKYAISFLKGSYGQKLIAQTGIGAVLNLIVSTIRNLFGV